MRFHRALRFVLLTSLAASACNRDIEPTQPSKNATARPARRALVRGSNRRRPAEDRLVQIANEIPGFAGYFVDGNHRLVAWVADTNNWARAAAALSGHIAADFAAVPSRIRPHGLIIQRADYDFQTLSDYRDIVVDSLLGAVPGIAFDDLDETANRVTIGILRSNAQAVQSAAEAKLAQFGVPLAAIHFVLADSSHTLAARRAASTGSASAMLNITKLEGGNPDTLGAGLSFISPSEDCTIGAVVDSGSARRWLTASHCTTNLWQLNRDTMSLENGTHIGLETTDPAPTQSCTAIPFTCWWHRSSDAVLVDFSQIGLSRQRRGVIARPPTRDSIAPSQIGTGVSMDSLIDTGKPWLYIYAWFDASQVTAGEEIDKVGMRSGWTYGTVTHTCVDWWLSDNSHKVYCGFEADGLYTRQGDSGGPVFMYDGLDGAVLIGNVSGSVGPQHTYNSGGSPLALEFAGEYVSSISSAMADLGTLTVTSGITIGTPSISGSLSGGVPTISWSPVSTTGTNTTQYRVDRWVWDASTYSWMSEGLIGTTTSTSYSDSSVPVSLRFYEGTSKPSGCIYTYVAYVIVAYNSGASAVSQTLYFQGDANGPDPDQIYCGDG